MWSGSIKADLAHVPRLRQERTELIDLPVTRRRELRVKSNRNLHSRRVAD